SYPEEFSGMKPGSKQFDATWSRLASDPARAARFGADQHQYIKETHYDPLVKKLADNLGIDVDTRSKALQNVIWSTAVQHNPNKGFNLIKRVLDNLAPGSPDPADLSDGDLIRAIYGERGRTDDKDRPVYFKKNNKKIQENVKKRFPREMGKALKALDE